MINGLVNDINLNKSKLVSHVRDSDFGYQLIDEVISECHSTDDILRFVYRLRYTNYIKYAFPYIPHDEHYKSNILLMCKEANNFDDHDTVKFLKTKLREIDGRDSPNKHDMDDSPNKHDMDDNSYKHDMDDSPNKHDNSYKYDKHDNSYKHDSPFTCDIKIDFIRACTNGHYKAAKHAYNQSMKYRNRALMGLKFEFPVSSRYVNRKLMKLINKVCPGTQ